MLRLAMLMLFPMCADDSDDEQQTTERMPSSRISTSMIKQATAHLHRHGRYRTTFSYQLSDYHTVVPFMPDHPSEHQQAYSHLLQHLCPNGCHTGCAIMVTNGDDINNASVVNTVDDLSLY